MRLGLVADTHGLLRPEALAALAGVDHVVHAGDVGEPGVLDGLRALAPVTAIRGNVDRGAWAEALPAQASVVLAGRRVLVVHALADWDGAAAADLVVCGHSHRPGVHREAGAVVVNPGSAGPRRFSLPVTVAIVELGDTIGARIVSLDVPPPRRR